MISEIYEAYHYGKQNAGQGALADYIPELAKVNPDHLGITVTDLKGENYSVGDYHTKFTIQSISKIVILATALHDRGYDFVFNHVGMEPTGDPFNSIKRLETATAKPMNPMINAGAISVTACIEGNAQEKFEKILTTARNLLGNQEISYDHNVYQSEMNTGSRNRALAHMMFADGVLQQNVEDTIAVYFKACSILACTTDISHMGAVLANGGRCLRTGDIILEPLHVAVICSLMATCGMYDASGEFALKVGLPAKSGVGGGIVAVVPHKLGIGVYAPLLDARGNSFCGWHVLEHLSNALKLNIYT